MRGPLVYVPADRSTSLLSRESPTHLRWVPPVPPLAKGGNARYGGRVRENGFTEYVLSRARRDVHMR